MRRIFPLLGIALLLGGFAGSSPAPAQTGGGNCEGEMAAETAAYIQSAGITINGSDTRFYSNANTRVFVLNSEDPVNMRSFAPFTNTFAVINYKEQGGKSVFLTLEQTITVEQISYTVKKGTQVLAAVTAPRVSNIPRTGTETDPVVPKRCLDLAAEAEQLAIQAQARANSTCETVFYCVGICVPYYSALHIAWTSAIVKPTSRFCLVDNTGPRTTNANWLTVTASPLVRQAIDEAIKTEALLYRAS